MHKSFGQETHFVIQSTDRINSRTSHALALNCPVFPVRNVELISFLWFLFPSSPLISPSSGLLGYPVLRYLNRSPSFITFLPLFCLTQSSVRTVCLSLLTLTLLHATGNGTRDKSFYNTIVNTFQTLTDYKTRYKTRESCSYPNSTHSLRKGEKNRASVILEKKFFFFLPINFKSYLEFIYLKKNFQIYLNRY